MVRRHVIATVARPGLKIGISGASFAGKSRAPVKRLGNGPRVESLSETAANEITYILDRGVLRSHNLEPRGLEITTSRKIAAFEITTTFK